MVVAGVVVVGRKRAMLAAAAGLAEIEMMMEQHRLWLIEQIAWVI